mgnify:CR=1 FL=1
MKSKRIALVIALGVWLPLAAASLLAIEHGFLPGTANTRTLDGACGPQIRIEPARGEVRLALSNSFGFGGNNCVLVLGRAGGSRP